MDLEGVWELREEQIYPSLFGPLSRGIFPLTHELFEKRLGQTDIDPRWLFHGVFEFGVYVVYKPANELKPFDQILKAIINRGQQDHVYSQKG